MTDILLDLDGFVVTNAGDVIIHYDMLLDRARRGQTIENCQTLPHPDVEKRNQCNPIDKISVREIDGKPTEISSDCFEWEIPFMYRNLDLELYLKEKLGVFNPDPMAVYIDRVSTEIRMMRERGMEDFIRVLIYMIDVFDQNNVVHGVGRGSACASLVLYLIGVHLVDPIEYEIPITEFLR